MAKKNKPWTKIFSLVGFSILCASGLTALGLGIANFVKYGSKKQGVGYADTLQTQLQLALDNSDSTTNTLQQQMETVENISNKVSLTASNIGANEIRVQSGINKDTLSNSQTIWNVADIFVYTEPSLYKFKIDFDIEGDGKLTNIERAERQANLDYERLGLYWTLAQTNTYQITNLSRLINTDNSTLSFNNFNEIYRFNMSKDANEISRAYVKNGNMMFDLRQTSNLSSKLWNLSDFQKQFTDVYKWDGDLKEKTRQDTINDNNSLPTDEQKTKTTPKNSYVLWLNRNGLINLLQTLTTIAYLNYHSSVFSLTEQLRIQTLYSKFASDTNYAKYMEWCGNNWNAIMQQLYDALNYDFGINNGSDPLLAILNSFYLTQDNNTDYSFLYSWNFENNTFLSSYLAPIDYNNWFNYFPQEASKKELENKDYLKDNYYSNSFNTNWQSSTYSVSNVYENTNLANNAAINNSFLNFHLLNVVATGISQISNVYNEFFNSFIDQSIRLIPSITEPPLIGDDSFIGAIISFSALILIIGIIVSVLYRIPGLLTTLTMISTYGLTLIAISGLSIAFSINTIFSLLSATFLPLVPFIYGNLKMRKAIIDKKMNINNSFKTFVSSYIWMSIMTFAISIIVGLVCIFFGQLQIKAFGSILVVSHFNTLAIGPMFFLLLLMPIYFWIIKYYPQLMLNKSDIKILSSIRNISSLSEINDNESKIKSSWSNKLSNKISLCLLANNWWNYLIIAILITLAIIGVFLLVFVNNSLTSFKYSNQIVLTYNINQSVEANDIINKLSSDLGIKWDNKYSYQLSDSIMQTVLSSTQKFDVDRVYQLIDPNWTNAITIRSNNIYFSNLLFNNAVQCLLISMGFIAIINIFMLNIINILPVFIISLGNAFLMVGMIGLMQLPINLNIIESYITLFIVNNVIVSLIILNIKKSFNKKVRFNYLEIKQIVVNNIEELLNATLFIALSYFAINCYMLLFDTASNYINYLANGILNIYSLLIAIMVIPYLISGALYVREKYLSNVSVNNLENQRHKWYDKVDEQIIKGINHH